MYRILLILVLANQIPVETLKLHFDYERKNSSQVNGYDASVDHPFTFGTVTPEWTSPTIDTIKVGKKRIIEYKLPVLTEYDKCSIHKSYSSPVTSSQIKEYAIPIKTELIFRFTDEVFEYMGLRCHVFKDPEDTSCFKNGLIIDVNPFTRQMISMWRYEKGQIIQEFLWLSSPTYNPNYTNHRDKHEVLHLLVRNRSDHEQEEYPSGSISIKNASEWTKISVQIGYYKYYTKHNRF